MIPLISCYPTQTSEEYILCLQIREAVFVQEQGVPLEMEMDDLDREAIHFLLRDETTGASLGTARLLQSGGVAQIGRVAVLETERGKGYGRRLMEAALQYAAATGNQEIILHAQSVAVPFYVKLGFSAEGEEFLEAGILHQAMRRRFSPS